MTMYHDTMTYDRGGSEGGGRRGKAGIVGRKGIYVDNLMR